MGMNDQECIEKLERISGYCCAQKDKDAFEYAKKRLKEIPGKGSWESVEIDNEQWSQCPFCNSKFYFNDEDRFAFCPRCGADLTEDKE